MALTQIDPTTALVVIDLQNGIVALPVVHPIADVVRQSRALADAFRAHALPVVLVTVEPAPTGRTEQPSRAGTLPAGWAEPVAEMVPQPGDHHVIKRTWGAFTQTDLEAFLKSRGVTQIVLAGVATSIGVESTARQARELGLNITLAVDAMTDLNADAHENSIKRIFPRLGETGTTQEIIDLLTSGRA